MVIVRQASITDAGAVAGLMHQLGYEMSAPHAARRLTRILQKPDHLVLIAETDGVSVGWLHASFSEHLDNDTCVLIEGLVVDRNHRRQGAGGLLLGQAEAWGRTHGCSMVRLRSTSTRTGAHRFYERLGYFNVKTQYSFAKGLDASGREAITHLVPKVED